MKALADGARKKRAVRSPRLRIDLLTLFPGIFDSPFDHSLLARAREQKLIDIRVHDIREDAEGRHRVADDAPYGGGDGMVMMADPVLRAIKRVKGRSGWVVLLSPAGKPLDQAAARRFAARRHLVIVCGRYGGIDERVSALAIDEEISIGDYVLGGGESAAIALVDAVARLVPGVVGNAASVTADSFEDGLLEYPQFTRPASVRGLEVPEVLLGGDHAKVARWRRKESIRRTLRRRPELLGRARLSKQDRLLLAEVRREEGMPEGKGHPAESAPKSSGRKTRKTRRVAKRKR